MEQNIVFSVALLSQMFEYLLDFCQRFSLKSCFPQSAGGMQYTAVEWNTRSKYCITDTAF